MASPDTEHIVTGSADALSSEAPLEMPTTWFGQRCVGYTRGVLRATTKLCDYGERWGWGRALSRFARSQGEEIITYGC